MIKKVKSIAANKDWIEVLFTLLILSFPFGSFFLSFSIGFMTVYPYLVLLVALSVLAFAMPASGRNTLTRAYLFFMCLFFAYATVQMFFTTSKSYALIDLRSIFLMLLTTWVFISVRNFLGFEKWKGVLLFSFRIIFWLIVSFGLFEIISGWHLAGEFTEKIIYRGIKDSLLYTPVFLWDNPNNYMLYVLVIGTVIIMLAPKSEKKSVEALLIFVVILVMAVFTEARSALFIVLIMALIYFTVQLARSWRTFRRSTIAYLAFVLVALTYTLNTQELFKKIPRVSEMVLVDRKPVFPIPGLGAHAKADLLYVPTSSDSAWALIDPLEGRNSKDERMALILNGLDFTKESNYLGIGPGQYRYRHDHKQTTHYTFGNNGAHFWPVELLSQFGVLIFAAYFAVMCWMVGCVVKNFRLSRELALGMVMGWLGFSCAMILPSAFLILDIHWIFTVILIVCAGEFYLRKTVAPE